MEAPAASRASQAPVAATAASAPDPDELFGGIDLSGRERIVVAVSGGSDSLALLLLLKRYLDTSGGKVLPLAVTVDHRLRPQSADEARRVREIAGGAGIAHRIVSWEGAKPATGISAAAREARHGLLAGAAREAGADIVFTGHTMDDQAETVAMRRLRGEGRGAAGIAPATLFDASCWFVRPLLQTRRVALRRFLTGVGQDWADDPSNIDRRFERARMRAELADAEVERLAAEAAIAGAAREALGRRAAVLIRAHAGMAAPGLVRLDKAFAAAEDREAALYALRILLSAVGGREHLSDAERAATLLDRLAASPGRATLSRCLVERRRGEVLIRRERRGKEAGAAPTPTLGPWTRYLPSFDLEPARATAELLGAAQIPPSPWANHNRPGA